MGLTIFHSLGECVATYGYWAVALALLCENAGIPVPGETTLLLASFLAYSEHKLHLGWIIVIATCAATLGDNIGYAIGHYGGRPLLDRYQRVLRISPATAQPPFSLPVSSSDFAFSPDRWPACCACAGELLLCSTSWVRPFGSP